MTQLKLEVGKKYIFDTLPYDIFLLTIEDLNSYYFENIKIDPAMGTILNRTINKKYRLNFNLTEHIEEPMKDINYVRTGNDLPQSPGKLTTNSAAKEEVKLEVGKTYQLIKREIEKLIPKKDLRILKLVYQTERECVFEDIPFARIYVFLKSELDEYQITEHREMIKNSVETWITYNTKDKPEEGSILDQLTNLYCNPEIYKTKKEAMRNLNDWDTPHPMYARITFEQLPEPKEENHE